MRSRKRLLCALLAVCLALSMCCAALADGKGSSKKSSKSAEAQAEAPEATPEPTQPPVEEPTTEPTAEPTEAPTEETTESVSKLSLRISSPDGLTRENGAYQIDTKTVQSITLKWKYSGKCDAYSIRVTNDQGSAVYTASQTEKKLKLSLDGFAAGQYTVTVSAMSGDQAVVSATLSFQLTGGGGGFSGFGGGGFGGGFGGFSGQGGAQVEQGFHVTPGTALTSAHSVGDKDMRIYGAVALDLDGETPMTALTLSDETTLDIALSDGGEFTAAADEGALALTPVDGGEAWTLNGYALKTLALSGIESLSLGVGGGTVEFSTAPALAGDAYGALSAAGYVSRDYEYTVSADGVTVTVGGERYRLGEDGELIPTEGQ